MVCWCSSVFCVCLLIWWNGDGVVVCCGSYWCVGKSISMFLFLLKMVCICVGLLGLLI